LNPGRDPAAICGELEAATRRLVSHPYWDKLVEEARKLREKAGALGAMRALSGGAEAVLWRSGSCQPLPGQPFFTVWDVSANRLKPSVEGRPGPLSLAERLVERGFRPCVPVGGGCYVEVSPEFVFACVGGGYWFPYFPRFEDRRELETCVTFSCLDTRWGSVVFVDEEASCIVDVSREVEVRTPGGKPNSRAREAASVVLGWFRFVAKMKEDKLWPTRIRKLSGVEPDPDVKKTAPGRVGPPSDVVRLQKGKLSLALELAEEMGERSKKAPGILTPSGERLSMAGSRKHEVRLTLTKSRKVDVLKALLARGFIPAFLSVWRGSNVSFTLPPEALVGGGAWFGIPTKSSITTARWFAPPELSNLAGLLYAEKGRVLCSLTPFVSLKNGFTKLELDAETSPRGWRFLLEALGEVDEAVESVEMKGPSIVKELLSPHVLA